MDANKKIDFSNNYLVSIIVPVYNAEKYLPLTFGSVRGQTVGFNNIQLIMIDDHSRDGSYGLISGWAEKYPNIKALQTSAGSGSASTPRNIGLDAAEADYIMFLDADDILRPDAVKLLYDAITTHNVDLADAAFKEYGSKSPMDSRYLSAREGEYRILENVGEWFPLSHPIVTKIYKRSIVDKIGLRFDPTLRNGEDSLFIYSYMSGIDRVWHINNVVYEYRISEDSVSHKRDEIYFIGLANACNRISDKLIDTPYEEYLGLYLKEVAVASLDILCDSTNIDDENCRKILNAFYPFFQYMGIRGVVSDVPIGMILINDAVKDDKASFVNDFFAFRQLYDQRRSRLEEIFSSRGWKLITMFNRIVGRNEK